MRSYSLAGTRPWNTRASVPRLMPLYSARTTTSSGDGDGNGSGRISPRPGAAVQNARALSLTGVNSGAFHGHVTIPGVDLRVRVVAGAAFACVVVAILATLAQREWPVGDLYEAKSAATLAIVMAIAVMTVRAHHPFVRFGAANQITMARAALVALVVGLIGEPVDPRIAGGATGLAVLVEVLDGVDGWLARRSSLASAFGARFDMEVDALLIMALAILAWQHGKAGVWVLLSGLLRYAFVVAGWLAPWLARPLPPSRRRQSICVVQIVALFAAVSPLVPAGVSVIVAAVALGVLAASFLMDIVWLRRARLATPTTARVPVFPSSS
jgi:phosphatidylglycerophosphate synthase